MDSNDKRKRKTVPEESVYASNKQQKRPKPDFSNPSSAVTFYIGKGEKAEPFLVHKEFACYYSPVLNAAFNSGFIEGETQTYRLEDITASAFRIFVQWLYTQEIHTSLERYGYLGEDDGSDDDRGKDDAGEDNTKEDSAGEADNQEASTQEVDNVPSRSKGDNATASSTTEDHKEVSAYDIACEKQELDLAQSWVLGEKFLIPQYQNSIMRKLQSLWKLDVRLPGWEWLLYVYEHTKSDSPLRNLVVDTWAYFMDPVTLIKNLEYFSKEMLAELVFTLSTATRLADGSDNLGRQIYLCERTWRDYLVPEDEGP